MNIVQKTKLAVILLACIFSSGLLKAQSIEIALDKKVIHTDSLNLPRQTSINTVLTMMSELLQRPSYVIYSNYDIKVNGLSVSDASDVALYQLHIQDVEKIEISESATSSYQKNGQGGSINLVLRTRSEKNSGLWGSVSIDVSHPTSVAPQLHLSYKKDKFSFAALILSDIYQNTSNTENLTFKDGRLLNHSVSENFKRYRSQLANITMEYKPTSKDLFKLNLSESYAFTKETSAPDYEDINASWDKSKKMNLMAIANYSHQTKRTKLEMELNYTYNPNNEAHLAPLQLDLEAEQNKNILAGKIEYHLNLLNPKSPNMLKLGVGNTFNLTFGKDEIEYQTLNYAGANSVTMKPSNNTYFTQPFSFIEARIGKFSMKAVGEFQHFRQKMEQDDNSHNVTSNDFTGQLYFEWHIAQHKALRLLGIRTLQRPSQNLLFPFMIFNPYTSKYMEGNPELTPIMTHEVRLDYIFNQRWDEHKLHYDLNVSYKNVSDMIETVTKGSNSGDGFGVSMMYDTFENHGKDHILSGNIMAMYSYKAFALTLTGNIFNNKQHTFDGSDHYTYYNISLNPHFNLKDGWQGSFEVTYNSSVETKYGTLSNCTQTATIIGKRWKNLYIYCFLNQTLHKFAKDISWYEGYRNEHRYEITPNRTGFGIKYLF